MLRLGDQHGIYGQGDIYGEPYEWDQYYAHYYFNERKTIAFFYRKQEIYPHFLNKEYIIALYCLQ